MAVELQIPGGTFLVHRSNHPEMLGQALRDCITKNKLLDVQLESGALLVIDGASLAWFSLVESAEPAAPLGAPVTDLFPGQDL